MDNNKQKKEDETEEPRRDDGSGGGFPKFNFTWIYLLVALGLLALYVSQNLVSQQPTTWNNFEQMARNGDVERLLIINEKEGQVFIKKDKLGQGTYVDIKYDEKKFNANQPQFVFKLGPKEGFSKRLKKNY